MSERDNPLLLLMLETVEKIETFTRSMKSAEEFEKNVTVYDASLMNFIVIGEMSGEAKKKTTSPNTSYPSNAGWQLISPCV